MESFSRNHSPNPLTASHPSEKDDLLRLAASGAVCMRGAVNKNEKKKPGRGRKGFKKGRLLEMRRTTTTVYFRGLFPATTIAHAVSTRRRDNFEEIEIINFPNER